MAALANPIVRINRGATISVTDYNGNSNAGIIYGNECFMQRGQLNEPGRNDIYYYSSAAGGYKTGWITDEELGRSVYAYWDAHSSDGAGRFEVRPGRRCRIYSASTHIDSIYGNDGGQVRTDGMSISGKTYPDRMKIEGYKKADGFWTYQPDLWCDTDILFGYPTTPTVYSSKMP